MIDKLFPLLLELLKQFADGVIDGEAVKQNQDLLEGIQFANGVIEVYGDNLTDLIPGDYDEQILETFKAFIKDTAKEGDFPVLVLAKIA